MITAPSGAGKSSLVKALLEHDPEIELSISHTTRAPRPGEANGREYHFISVNEFEERKARGEFLESALCTATITAQAAFGSNSAWPREKTFYLRLTGRVPVRYVLNLKEQWAFSFCRPQLTLSKHDCTNAAPTAKQPSRVV